mgnify:FL=1
MKFKFNRVVATILVVLLSVMTFVSNAPKSEAAVQSDVITKFEVTDENGNPLTGEVEKWQKIRVYGTFKLPDNQVHEGDTTVLELPDQFKFGDGIAPFDLKDANGQVVAKAVPNPRNRTVTLTYTKYVETHSGVKGRFYFYIRVNHEEYWQPQNIPVAINVSGKVPPHPTIKFKGVGVPHTYVLRKGSWQVSGGPNPVIGYTINVNENNQVIQGGFIYDVLKTPGVAYNKSSIVIKKGTWVIENNQRVLKNPVDVTNQYPVNWKPDDSGFTINFGDISSSEGFEVGYTANIGYEPVDGEIFDNDIVLTGKNGQIKAQTEHFKFMKAGGQAEGYIFKIKIKKENEKGEPLKDAKFNVVRVRTNKVVGTLTTNASGEAEVGGLLRDEYKIIETDAPAGYKKLTEAEAITVNPADFGSDSIALKTIKNEKAGTGVKFSKVAAGQGTELAGAKLTVKRADDTVVETWDSTGTAKEISLPAGEYKMIEDQAPLGYDKAETIEFKVELDGSVKIKQGNSWVAANEAKVQMVDELKSNKVKFSKVAAGQGTELVGADITVSGKDIYNQPFSQTWKSDGNAKELKLKAGEYKMEEDQAPLGYDKAETIEFKVELNGSVKIKENGQWVDAAEAKVQMVDELTDRDVTFSKVAAGQGKELKGAKITVSGKDIHDRLYMQTWISEGDAKVLKLKAGEYTMVEDQAPLGYDKATSINFRVKEDGTVEVNEGGNWTPAADAKLQMIDELTKYDVTFSKVEAGQGNELKGAKITVSGKNIHGEDFNESWTSDGTAKKLKLEAGVYKMVEDQAPLGYDKAAEITFRVNKDGSVDVKEGDEWKNAKDAKLQMIDELTKYDVTFSKVAAGQGKELKGAKLTVKRADGTVVASWKSTGVAKVLKLPAGEYIMIEDQAPLGYKKAANIKFRINKDGSVEIQKGDKWIAAKDAKVQMVDELLPKKSEKKEAPDTSDMDNIYTLMLMMLLASATMVGVGSRKRKNIK